MNEELLTEIRKLEVRLQEFIEAEQKAIESLKDWISTLKELHNLIDKIEGTPELAKRAIELRLKSVKAFQEALKEIGRAEHEKSHLLESYGAILLLLEELFSKTGKIKSENT